MHSILCKTLQKLRVTTFFIRINIKSRWLRVCRAVIYILPVPAHSHRKEKDVAVLKNILKADETPSTVRLFVRFLLAFLCVAEKKYETGKQLTEEGIKLCQSFRKKVGELINTIFMLWKVQHEDMVNSGVVMEYKLPVGHHNLDLSTDFSQAISIIDRSSIR